MPAGPWEAVPSLLAMAEPNGPVEQAFFDRLMQRWEQDLTEAGPLDGVYLVLHGAGLTTSRTMIPRARCLALVRRIVGPEACRLSPPSTCMPTCPKPMSTLLNGFIGYRTNPHLDMRERGAEAASLLRRLLDGTRSFLARIRLPIVPPTVTQLTGKDAPNRPYGELIDLGQQRMTEAAVCGARAECLGHGRVRLCRYAVQWPHRGGNRHRPSGRRRAGRGRSPKPVGRAATASAPR